MAGRRRRNDDDRQYLQELAGRIVAARTACRWTQAELAERAGVGRWSVYGWELGAKMPGARAVLLMARAMNVNVGWLLRGPRKEEP